MLDKNIPYHRIILKRESGTHVPDYPLPEGYRFEFFKSGDEEAWAKIETSVLEFENEEKALEYFRSKYIPLIDELKKRTLFVVNEHDEKIATITAWYDMIDGVRHPFMHWVACKPEYQGRGIGKALISRGTSLMCLLEGDVDMYIPTQTWSHRAIRIYRWAGFELIMDTKQYGNCINQAEDGYMIIKDLI